MTKYPPAISQREIIRAGVFVLRWQDLHRRMLRERARSQADQFIAQHLVKYLEELGMAYREDLSIKDLELLRRILRTAAAPTDRQISPRNGFQIADACLNLLHDVRRRFMEGHRRIESYRRWGPGYFVWFNEEKHRWHGFGWELYKRKWKKEHFGFSLWLPERTSKPIEWSLYLEGSAVKPREEVWPSASMVARGGTVDPDALLRSLDKYARRWGIV